MPKVAIDIGDTYESVVRPVVKNAIEEVKAITGLTHARTIFQDDADNIPQRGGNIGASNSEVAFAGEAHLILEVETLYQEVDLLRNISMKRDSVALFKDDELGVMIVPMMSQVRTVINVQYTAQSKTEANRWLAKVKRKSAAGLKEIEHNVEYHYYLPREFLSILNHVHELRENQGGYGQDLSAYIDEHSHPRLTFLTNQSGQRKEWGVRERQGGVVGYFSFEAIPEKEQGENGTWLSQFSYTIEFDQPHSAMIDYPYLVHNQLIDVKYFDTSVDNNRQLELYLSSISRQGLDILAQKNQPRPMSSLVGYSIPAFDNWQPSNIPKGTTTVAKIMLGVDASDPTNLVNIGELGDFALLDDVLAYMKLRHVYVTRLGAAPLLITLYQDGNAMDENVIEMDADGNVTSTIDLAIRRQYHLRIAVYNDLSLINESSIKHLRAYGSVATTILVALEQRLKDSPLLTLASDGSIPKRAFWDAVALLKRTPAQYKNHIEVSRLTAASLVVTAHRAT